MTQGNAAMRFKIVSQLTINVYRPTAYGVTEESAKLCDVVYYNDIINFNTTTDVVTASVNAAS